MMNKMEFDDYYKKIREAGCIHAYINQDYGYDEYGNFYLVDCYDCRIIKGDDLIYKKDCMFSSFKNCEDMIISKCKEMKMDIEYIVKDKHRDDGMVLVRKLCK